MYLLDAKKTEGLNLHFEKQKRSNKEGRGQIGNQPAIHLNLGPPFCKFPR
jgi:hypothetical protein